MPTCPACAAPAADAAVAEQSAAYRLLHCGQCDVVFCDPMPDVNGSWYSRQVMSVVRDRFMAGTLRWNHREFLADVPASGGRLLDVGCGTGDFVAAAEASGYRACGLDFDVTAVGVAAERLKADNLFAGDLDAFRRARPGEQFDVVSAFEVLEHTTAPGAFMGALVDLVAPGGILAISVPNRERWPRFRYDWDRPPHHLTRWSPAALTGLLSRHGLTVKRVAKGWPQAEPFLHQHLRFGLVGGLLRRGLREGYGAPVAPGSGAMRAASAAFMLKDACIRILKVPLHVSLRLAGETGMDLYVLAQRTAG